MITLSKKIFYFFLAIYLLFPNEIKDWGIGNAGMRILFLDIFVILIILINITYLFNSLFAISKIIPRWAIFVFSFTIVFSLMRGMPLYGGFAIGEGRWFLSSILLPVGFIFYDGDVIKNIKKMFYFAAIFHSLIILYNLVFLSPNNLLGDAVRFGSGRQSLIINLACIFLIIELILNYSLHRIRKISLIIFFFFILLVTQTRTIFVLFPLTVAIILIITQRINFKYIRKLALYLILVFIISIVSFQIFIKSKVEKSITESFGVIAEIFDPSTYYIILHPDLLNYYSQDFSSYGNTLWRAYAWGQTLQNINNYSFGWVVGLPMGSGYDFYDPSGNLIENLDPHNDYLSILSKIGLLGLTAYLIIVFYFFYYFFKIKELIIHSYERLIQALILFSIIFSLCLFSFINVEIRTYGTYFWIWIFLGFGYKMIDNFKNNSETSIKI